MIIKVKDQGREAARKKLREGFDERTRRLFYRVKPRNVEAPSDEEVVRAWLKEMRLRSERGYLALLRTTSDGERSLGALIEAGEWARARLVIERLESGSYW